METLPTQDVCDGDFSEEDESSQETAVWGRLFPLGSSFVAVGETIIYNPDTAANSGSIVYWEILFCLFANVQFFMQK